MADKATVPIYYESRVAKLGLNQSELPKIDEEFEAITEGEVAGRARRMERHGDAATWTERSAARTGRSRGDDDCIKLKTEWAALEALVGNRSGSTSSQAWHLRSTPVPDIDIV